MTREEAIAELNTFKIGAKSELGKNALDRAIKAIEQEPRWIPTNERYPKPDDEYKFFLVTDDKGKVSVQKFYLSLDEEPQPYFSGMVNVIAWMPLPELSEEAIEQMKNEEEKK